MRRLFIRAIIAGIAAMGAALMPALAQTANWQSYGSELGFSIDFPGAPSRADNTNADTPPNSRFTFVSENRMGVFVAEKDDFSNVAGAPTAEDLVEGITKGVLGVCTATISQSPFAVPGGAGLETFASGCGGKYFGRLKVYGVGSYTYSLLVLTTSQEALTATDYIRFFDSFRMAGK